MSRNANKQSNDGGAGSTESNGKEALDQLVTEIEAKVEESTLVPGKKKDIRMDFQTYRKPGSKPDRAMFARTIMALNTGVEEMKKLAVQLAAMFPEKQHGEAAVQPQNPGKTDAPSSPAVMKASTAAKAKGKPGQKPSSGGEVIPPGMNNQADPSPSTGKKDVEYNFLPRPSEDPKLADLKISPLSRSFGVPPAESRVTKLEKSIGVHGLLQPVILVAVNGGEGGVFYEIVCGAGRVEALKRIRGVGGKLKPDEFRIIDMDSKDKRLASVSLSENQDRGGLSAYESAVLCKHLEEDQGFTQDELGSLLDRKQSEISGLNILAKRFEQLPDSWQKQLSMAADADPVITFSHWRVVSSKFKPDEKPDKRLLKICEKAVQEEWSVAALKAALGPSKKRGANPVTDKDNVREPPPPAIEAPGVADKTRKVAEADLRSCAEELARIAEVLHVQHPDLEAKVRDALSAVEAEIKGLGSKEAA